MIGWLFVFNWLTTNTKQKKTKHFFSLYIGCCSVWQYSLWNSQKYEKNIAESELFKNLLRQRVSLSFANVCLPQMCEDWNNS